MPVYELVFISMMVLGFTLFVLRLFVGELGDLFGGDVDTIDDGPSWFSLSLISVALISFGGVGLALSHYDLVGFPAFLIQIFVTAGAYIAVRQFIIKPMMSQQGNSTLSTQSYVGLVGTVTIPISPEKWGQIQIIDGNGARVMLKAVTSNDMSFAANQHVKITSYVGNQAVVASV